jgi:Sel1 repeat
MAPSSPRPNVAELSAKAGEAFSAKNYADAVKWYLEAAALGDANAQQYVGVLYFNGQGVQQNYVEALKWIQKSADQGNAIAQRTLGSIYLVGQGVKQDDAEAARWYGKAAARGDVEAQTALTKLQQDIVKRTPRQEPVELVLVDRPPPPPPPPPPVVRKPEVSQSGIDFSRPVYTKADAIICPISLFFSRRADRDAAAIRGLWTTIWGRSQNVKDFGCEEWQDGIQVRAKLARNDPNSVVYVNDTFFTQQFDLRN